MTTSGGPEAFIGTVRAGGDVRRERHELLARRVALDDAEVVVVGERQVIAALDRFDDGKRRRARPDLINELADGAQFAFDINEHTRRIVQDSPFERTSLRFGEDEGAKANALNDAPHQDLNARVHT